MSPPYFRQIVSLNVIFVLFLLMGFFTHMDLSQSVIENLPGFPGKLPFRLETGYIGVGESEEVQLFYYFIESEGNPEMILFFFGSPEALAVLVFPALFMRLSSKRRRKKYQEKCGPIIFDYANSSGSIPTLVLNPFSWTKVANIIFLDQPAGTGFSYAKTPEAYKCSDTLSGRRTYEFLTKWLVNHPKYLKNPLYIAGDSYSGITLPLVVNEVYNGIEAGSKPLLNMKGYILGNPLTDVYGDFNGRVAYAHRMGLLSDELYLSAKENCYGYYLSVDPDNRLCKDYLKRVNQCLEKIRKSHILEPWCDTMWTEKRDQLLHHMPLYEEIAGRFLQSVPLHAESWCRDNNALYSYKWANIKLVQKALHVRENGGDHDMVVPHTRTEEWIKSLKLVIQSDWRPWFVDGQIAGYSTAYFHDDYELTYATVKGAGHTAPEFKPVQCLPMIKRWLSRSPL